MADTNYENNYYAPITGLQMQQGTNNSSQNQTVSQGFNYEEVRNIIENIKKYEDSFDSEFKEKANAENAEIALEYAKGLFNQCCDEELSGCRSCVAKLEELHKVYEGNAEIAWRYAKGLFNQSNKEDLSGARSCVAKLEELHTKFPEDAEIESIYEKGLYILSTK